MGGGEGELDPCEASVPSSATLSLLEDPNTYVFKEEVKLPMILRVDGGFEKGKEDVLQHLPKVWQ